MSDAWHGDGRSSPQRSIENRSTTPNRALRSIDFATQYGFKEFLEHQNLKFRILEPADKSYGCYDLTFHNGRIGEKGKLNDEDAYNYIKAHFKILGSKEDFKERHLLYNDLIEKISKNKDSCIAIYIDKKSKTILHASPILEVYPKENGNLSIMLFGKWGSIHPLGIHDIEDVPDAYRDDGSANWRIYFTDRENGRIMDL